MKDGILTKIHIFDAVSFSISIWTSLGSIKFIVPDNLQYLTALETINSYFYMAILIALIVIWIEEKMSALDARMTWLRSLSRDDVQKIQDQIDSSVIIKGSSKDISDKHSNTKSKEN